MAKFVLAGRADCPYYAKAELLADYLQKNLPYFRVHKITQHPDDWEEWLNELCKTNGWKHQHSPIIWRELLDRGGKGLFLGGFNDFMEHAQEYYNITSAMMSDLMKDIAVENLETHIEIQKEQTEIQNDFDPLHVWITSASAPTCYSLISILASGEVFGRTKEIWLHLLDNSQCKETLHALKMEAEDLAFPLLREVTTHTMTDNAFHEADFVIVIDVALVKKDQSPDDNLKAVAEQCRQYGALIDQNAHKGVKVVVAGSSYVNLRALMILSSAPSLDRHSVVGLPTQLEFEAKAQIGKKLNINSAAIKDVIVWGNISGINHLDLREAKIYQYDSAIWGPPSFWRPLLSMIFDRNWIKSEFLTERIRRREHRSGMSAAHSIAKVLSWWQQDSDTGEIVSLAVISEGQFELPEGIVYSVPVQFKNGDWQVYTQTSVPEDEKETLLQAAKELIKEKEIALQVQQEPEDAQIIIDKPKESANIEEVLPAAPSSESPLHDMENIENTSKQEVLPTAPCNKTPFLEVENLTDTSDHENLPTAPSRDAPLSDAENNQKSN
ncbi:putative malate dehydrogenase 1B [Rhinophrynus dorsalis]